MNNPSRLIGSISGLLAAILVVWASTTALAQPNPVPAGHAGRSPLAAGVVPLAPEVASYAIQARLSDDGHAVQGTERVRYRNPSTDTLTEVYLHLYLNAFRSADTLWLRESAQGHRGFRFDPAEAGWIKIESLVVDGRDASVELDETETIAKVPLDHPLLPNGELTLNITWTSQLPRVFARTGWAPGGFTMVGQWYPKMAVYDPRRGGWDREPWHANAEFFADFGNYELALTVPAARTTVIANGEPDGNPRDNGDGTATWLFHATSVSDAVWMAAEHFTVRSGTSGDVLLAVALPEEHADQAARHLATADYALRHYGEWLGPYPWPRFTIVVPPANAGGAGGMEYPTLVTSMLADGLPDGVRMPEVTTAHETAHEWFPMQVATNEARDPWMDEAFADYLTQRLLAERYGEDRSLVDLPFGHMGYLSLLRSEFAVAPRLPITRPSWEYTALEYGAAVYGKGSLFLTTLERVFGRERFTTALRGYVSEWRWRHPLATDFGPTIDAWLARETPAAPGSAAGAPPARQSIQPWLDQLAFGERVLDVRVSEVQPTRAVITRTGDATLPVDGTLLLPGAQAMPWQLSTEAPDLILSPPVGDQIAGAVADPERKLVIEPNRLDDGMLLQTERSALSGVTARLVEWLALFLQFAGQFG